MGWFSSKYLTLCPPHHFCQNKSCWKENIVKIVGPNWDRLHMGEIQICKLCKFVEIIKYAYLKIKCVSYCRYYDYFGRPILVVSWILPAFGFRSGNLSGFSMGPQSSSLFQITNSLILKHSLVHIFISPWYTL